MRNCADDTSTGKCLCKYLNNEKTVCQSKANCGQGKAQCCNYFTY